MYCVACGTENPDYGRFCHSCGASLFHPLSQSVTQGPHPISKPLAGRSEHDLLTELIQSDPKPNECHKCGRKADLTRYPFGIAKVLSVKRDWGETAARATASAASLALAPIIGFAVVSWKKPGKRISYSVLKSQLVLCRGCVSEGFWGGVKLRDRDYQYHPWSERARRIGYDKYLSAENLAKLTPQKPKE
jgi:hypothetical protein